MYDAFIDSKHTKKLLKAQWQDIKGNKVPKADSRISFLVVLELVAPHMVLFVDDVGLNTSTKTTSTSIKYEVNCLTNYKFTWRAYFNGHCFSDRLTTSHRQNRN